MGVVVAAHHLQLDEKVALKFLLPEALGNPEAVARFDREARAAVKIKSEHVARVIDVGRLETGAPYMVMEYLEGGDLAAWLHQRGPMPVEQAIAFVLQACEAIAEAHAVDIVHRDLKPANLFCIRRADGQLSVKVLDFGISKVAGHGVAAHDMGMTSTSAIIGSPIYMSPEQMQSSKAVDARTDIWSLGIILFELIAGRPPFAGESATELAIKIATEPPPPLRAFRPDVPPGLEAVLGQCLQKDRTRRFPNVAELSVALLPFAPRRSRASVERIAGTLQVAGLSTSALAMAASPQDPRTLVSAGQPTTVPPVSRTAATNASKKSVAILVVAASTVVLVGSAGALVLGKAMRGPAREVHPPSTAALGAATAPAPENAPPVAASAPAPIPSAPVSLAPLSTQDAPGLLDAGARPSGSAPARAPAGSALPANITSQPAPKPAPPPSSPSNPLDIAIK
jgi:serine/threonine-protein kinase